MAGPGRHPGCLAVPRRQSPLQIQGACAESDAIHLKPPPMGPRARLIAKERPMFAIVQKGGTLWPILNCRLSEASRKTSILLSGYAINFARTHINRRSNMRTTPLLVSTLGAILMSAGVVTAYAAEGVFYDPSNAASPTGKTIGYELYRTIGCPVRQLLDTPCPVPAPPAAVTAAAEPAPAPEPAYVAPPAPAPAAYVAPAPMPPQKLVLEGVNFDFDKATLRQEDIAIIDKDVTGLDKWGNVNIEVAGHTDSRGSDKYNMKLSQRRAEAVRNYLISKGIAADRLTAKGYGESQPVADNATDEGRFKNRRVELIELR